MASTAQGSQRELLEELVEQLGELFSTIVAEVAQLRRELTDIRSDVVALSNRIESTNRVLASRTEHLA